MATLDEQIEELEGILNNGMKGMSSDGQSATWDLEAVERRLESLRAKRDLQSTGKRGFGLRVGRIQYGDANGNN